MRRLGILPIYKKEGRSFAALRGLRETEEFEANQHRAAAFFATTVGQKGREATVSPAAGRVEALEVREGEIDGENRLPDRAQATSVSGGHPGLRIVGDAGPRLASTMPRSREPGAARPSSI
jgi:hypothetical protein